MKWPNKFLKIVLSSAIGLLSTHLSANQSLDQLSIRSPNQPAKIARVRIGVELLPFDKLMLKDRTGAVAPKFRPAPAIKNNIRARIDSTNHFYMNDWHVETIPLSWHKETKSFKIKMRFYKRYGDHKSLEEVIGMIDVEGILNGQNYIYDFKASKKANFLNLLGEPILDVKVLEPSPMKEGVATTVEAEEKSNGKGSL